MMDSGCSGCPVFKNGCVVGKNFMSFEMLSDEHPLFFITPIEYLLDLQLSHDEGAIKSSLNRAESWLTTNL